MIKLIRVKLYDLDCGICVCCFFECVQMGIFPILVWYTWSNSCLKSLRAKGYNTYSY